jgi:hypothetical protein
MKNPTKEIQIKTENVKQKIRKPVESYIILKAFANVVTTKGSDIQNQGLRVGKYSIVMITAAEIKK